jgi:hypothetical protein
MVPIHKNFRFDNRNETLFLAEGGIAAQHMSIDTNAGIAREVLRDVDNCAPLREPRALRLILLQPLAQTVEALSDRFTFAAGERLRTCIDFDSWNNPLSFEDLKKRLTFRPKLAERFVVGITPLMKSLAPGEVKSNSR